MQYLCQELNLSKYFIHGSPVHKNKLVENVLSQNSYNNFETILIGDSINDFEAAKVNKIDLIMRT